MIKILKFSAFLININCSLILTVQRYKCCNNYLLLDLINF